jgi:hypothetical protein
MPQVPDLRLSRSTVQLFVSISISSVQAKLRNVRNIKAHIRLQVHHVAALVLLVAGPHHRCKGSQ